MDENDLAKVRQTYLALRSAMVLLVLLLAVSLVHQAWDEVPDCFQHSISAYFYTGSRSVFVGALCAVGVCLIVYRGNTATENVVLDYAGFMALVVAFVPTRIDDTCTASNVPTAGELTAAVRNNVLALIVVLVVVVAFSLRHRGTRATGSDPAKWTALVGLLALVGLVVFFAGWPGAFERYGHAVSAILLFVGIIAVTVVNAAGLRAAKGTMNRYSVVALLMLVSVGGCLVARWAGFGHWLLVLEALLITLYAVFWVMQTEELRGRVSRTDRPGAPSGWVDAANQRAGPGRRT